MSEAPDTQNRHFQEPSGLDDLASQAVPAATKLVDAIPGTTHEGKERQVSIDEVIAEIDKKLEGKYPVSLAQAWRYREEVRAKYGLPECGGRWEDPLAYIHVMEDILSSNDVNLRGKHEFEAFFDENPTAGAVTMSPDVFRNTTVVAQAASSNDWWQLRARANQLAHEGVHALQFQRSPRMPDEEGEREAYYYQMLTPQQILKYKDDPTYLLDQINGSIEQNVQNSVKTNANI